MQGAGLPDPEESKDSSSRNLYAAHIVRQGLNKEGWKLVITGAAITIVLVVCTNAASGVQHQPLHLPWYMLQLAPQCLVLSHQAKLLVWMPACPDV